MTNRFCDTDIWEKDWFLDLSTKQKLLVKFLFDKCDCAGFYKISWNLLKVFFNDVEITRQDFEQIKQVKFIDENLIFIEDFALFQCKIRNFKELNPKNKAHLGVLRLLKKYNVFDYEKLSPFEAPSKPLESPFKGAQEKEKEKEKEYTHSSINRSIENKSQYSSLKEKKENFSKVFEPFDSDRNVERVINLYSELCKNLVPVMYERRNKDRRQEIKDFLYQTDNDFSYIQELFRRANSQKMFYSNKINLKSLIKNHAEIYQGLGAIMDEKTQGNTDKLAQKLDELERKYRIEDGK